MKTGGGSVTYKKTGLPGVACASLDGCLASVESVDWWRKRGL